MRADIYLHRESTNLVFDREQVMAFDLAGRLLTVYDQGRLYQRGLDHRIVEKWRAETRGQVGRIRHDLTRVEKERLIADVREKLTRLLADLPEGTGENDNQEIRQRLMKMVAWDQTAYAVDSDRFRAIYRPVAILPPDQYRALVLQATESCHYNECLFCEFYRRQPFRIKDQAEFRQHIQAVKTFMGESIRLRHSIFLADANALVIPHSRLMQLFNALNESFEIAPPMSSGLGAWRRAHPNGIVGVYSFIDAFTGKRKTRTQFEEMYSKGLRRVYVGMESGHEPLLRFLRKPSQPADVIDLVQNAKAAGVNVGLVVMLGIGGDRFAPGHVEDSAAVINQLGLGSGDIVYFSPFVDAPGSAYSAETRHAGIRPLTGDELSAQASALRDRFRLSGKVKISTYNIREFIY